jgi:DNA repair exonuclease SbcCD ATPase subunit
MLESIEFENFQGHETIRIDLDPKVTTIVGPTDSGKTSVIRGLGWVALNRPSGASLVRKGAKLAKARLKVDGKTVVRIQGKARNEYDLNGKVFKAFGKGTVPSPVARLLKMDPVNFQWQLDPPFWFTESAGQVSKNLNRIVNLEVIDRTMELAAQGVRRAAQVLDTSKARLAAADLEVRKRKWIVEYHDELQRIISLQAAYQEKYALRGRCEVLLAALLKAQDDVRSLESALDSGRKLLTLGERLAEVTADAAKLKAYRDRIRELVRIIQRPIPDDIGPLLRLRKEADELAERRRRLEYGAEELHQAEARVCDTRTRLAEATRRLATLTEGLPQTCPICGQSVSSRTTPSTSSRSGTSTSPSPPRRPGPRRTG